MGFGFPNPVPTYSVFLYSHWVTCPYSHLLYTSFLCLRLVRSSSASGLLPSLLHLLFVRMDHSWAWRRWSLKSNQLFWTPPLSRNCIPWDESSHVDPWPPQQVPEHAKESPLQESRPDLLPYLTSLLLSSHKPRSFFVTLPLLTFISPSVILLKIRDGLEKYTITLPVFLKS